jgi:hypothetical protein
LSFAVSEHIYRSTKFYVAERYLDNLTVHFIKCLLGQLINRANEAAAQAMPGLVTTAMYCTVPTIDMYFECPSFVKGIASASYCLVKINVIGDHVVPRMGFGLNSLQVQEFTCNSKGGNHQIS